MAIGLVIVECLTSVLSTERRVGAALVLLKASVLLLHASVLLPSLLLLLLQIVRPLSTHLLSGVSDVLIHISVGAHVLSSLHLVRDHGFLYVYRPRLEDTSLVVVQKRNVRVQLTGQGSDAILLRMESFRV